MNWKNLIWVVYSLICTRTYGQGFGTYLSKYAIPVDSTLTLDSTVYEQIRSNRLIMVGEMHGTQEPARLVAGLADLILKYEDSVIIGLEIPESEMLGLKQAANWSDLLATPFFAEENVDGRNGTAWFELLRYGLRNSKIRLFFFDNYQASGIANRDSAMYVSARQQLLQSPGTKVLTISGNLHSSMISETSRPTMGTYFRLDTLFGNKEIRSIYHVFSEGTMLNNTGNGLELHTVPFEASVYSESTPYDTYLVFYQTAEPSEANSIFYTRKVIHSPALPGLVIPDNYVVLYEAEGDLNNDQVADHILVFAARREDTLSTHDHPVKRKVLMYLSTKEGWKTVSSDQLIYYYGYDINFGDAFTDVQIDAGSFTIYHYGGAQTRWSRETQFTWDPQDGNFYLTKDLLQTFDALNEAATLEEKTLLPNDIRIRLEDFNILKE